MIEKGHIAVSVLVRLYRPGCARTLRVYSWLATICVVHWPQSRYKSNNNFDFFRIRHFVLLTIFSCLGSFCIAFDELKLKLKLQRQKSLTISSPLKPPLYFDCLNAIYVNCMMYWGRGQTLISILISLAIFFNKYFFYQFSTNMLVS